MGWSLPEIPESWGKFFDRIVKGIILIGVAFGVRTGCKVQDHQAVNTAVLQGLQADAAEVKASVNDHTDKLDTIKAALPRK